MEKKIVDIEQLKEERRLGQFQRHVFFLLTMVCSLHIYIVLVISRLNMLFFVEEKC